MNQQEIDVYKRMTKNGWTLLKNGWPDFLAVKNGEARFIEVKGNGGQVSKSQKQMHDLLYKCFGVKTEIIRFGDIYESKEMKQLMKDVKPRLRGLINAVYK